MYKTNPDVNNSVVLEEHDPCKREDKVNGNEKIKRLKGWLDGHPRGF